MYVDMWCQLLSLSIVTSFLKGFYPATQKQKVLYTINSVVINKQMLVTNSDSRKQQIPTPPPHSMPIHKKPCVFSQKIRHSVIEGQEFTCSRLSSLVLQSQMSWCPEKKHKSFCEWAQSEEGAWCDQSPLLQLAISLMPAAPRNPVEPTNNKVLFCYYTAAPYI